MKPYEESSIFPVGGDLPLGAHFSCFLKIGDFDGGAAQIHAEAVFHGMYVLLSGVSATIIHDVQENFYPVSLFSCVFCEVDVKL